MNSKILISLILAYFFSLSRTQGFLSPTQENTETIVFPENSETILETQLSPSLQDANHLQVHDEDQTETISAVSIVETLQAGAVEPVNLEDANLQEFSILSGEAVNMDAAFDTTPSLADESDEELLDSEFTNEEYEGESTDCGTEDDDKKPAKGSCITKIHCTMVYVARIGWTPIYKTEVVCG